MAGEILPLLKDKTPPETAAGRACLERGPVVVQLSVFEPLD